LEFLFGTAGRRDAEDDIKDDDANGVLELEVELELERH
jgi:hypothetical protein